MTSRKKLINQWVTEKLGQDDFSIESASSDASFRQYFRISYDNKTCIVMDAPPDKEDIHPFIQIGEYLLNVGINVPVVLEKDIAKGLLLISDLGSTQYLHVLSEANADKLYSDAFDALHLMQANVRVEDCQLPAYDSGLLAREVELFREWFLVQYLKIELDRKSNSLLDEAFEVLIESALEQPQVCVHRDYHSRNLMVVDEDNPGVLDFQDAVFGPITYDLVSLLRDCYIAWPIDNVEAWAKSFSVRTLAENSGYKFSQQQFMQWFDLMGVQRHLKAIGIFSRLNIRDAKPGYLQDIPRTLNYILEVSQRYTQLQPLYDYLNQNVVNKLNVENKNE